jgi:hypothetical protein
MGRCSFRENCLKSSKRHPRHYCHKSLMVSDIHTDLLTAVGIHTDLHNYLCNNSGIEATVDVIVAVVRLNLHSQVVMDAALADYNNQDVKLIPLGIDSDWRNSDRMDYSNQLDTNCNNSMVVWGWQTDKGTLLVAFVSR